MYCLFFFLLVSSIISYGDAVRCFECNSETDPFCRDPFDKSSFPYIDCDFHDPILSASAAQLKAFQCEKTTIWVERKAIITRRCTVKHSDTEFEYSGRSRSSAGYGSAYSGGSGVSSVNSRDIATASAWARCTKKGTVETCFCNTDYCNASHRSSVASSLLTTLAVAILAVLWHRA